MSRIKTTKFKTPQIVLPERGQGRYWLLVAGVWRVLGWSSLMYDLGRQQAGYHSLEAIKIQTRLQNRVEQLTEEKAALQIAADDHQRARQIDRDAARLVQDGVKTLQDERAKLKREIAFLRELVSAGDGDLQIRDFRLEALGRREFQYRLTVIQAVENVSTVRGKLGMSVSGLLQGRARTFKLSELDESKKDARKLRFKNFQDVTGRLVLPVDFEPSTVTIEITPEDRKLKPLQHIIDWRVTKAENA